MSDRLGPLLKPDSYAVWSQAVWAPPYRAGSRLRKDSSWLTAELAHEPSWFTSNVVRPPSCWQVMVTTRSATREGGSQTTPRPTPHTSEQASSMTGPRLNPGRIPLQSFAGLSPMPAEGGAQSAAPAPAQAPAPAAASTPADPADLGPDALTGWSVFDGLGAVFSIYRETSGNSHFEIFF